MRYHSAEVIEHDEPFGTSKFHSMMINRGQVVCAQAHNYRSKSEQPSKRQPDEAAYRDTLLVRLYPIMNVKSRVYNLMRRSWTRLYLIVATVPLIEYLKCGYSDPVDLFRVKHQSQILIVQCTKEHDCKVPMIPTCLKLFNSLLDKEIHHSEHVHITL